MHAFSPFNGEVWPINVKGVLSAANNTEGAPFIVQTHLFSLTAVIIYCLLKYVYKIMVFVGIRECLYSLPGSSWQCGGDQLARHRLQ